MIVFYLATICLHLATVSLSIILFVIRFFWLCRRSPLLQQRWVKILPHINDTLLLISGIGLIMLSHTYPFMPGQSWLTEKLFGVIIYILLGVVALGKRPRSWRVRWLAFVSALLCYGAVVLLSLTQLPLLME
ncbi:SirB2 family protein [Pectobacterium cacticida]|uniref:SirB2 family protein n=1 Tax=Pectobacterium cacticida TaxID=69221 RepID=A0ABZ2GEA9_9GAMM|nr:SirB2 family protein [Pectobacterium cacticida]UYX08647.1 SirB2 family protein [Pectobacterium cacticida]